MDQVFNHIALELQTEKPLIFTAMSKHLFYFRLHIQKFVLENGGIPLNPFTTFDYFLLDTVNRDLVREGNNNLVRRSDELWVFGPVSNGVLAEIEQVQKQNKTIRYFTIRHSKDIIEVTKDQVEMEDEVKEFKNKL